MTSYVITLRRGSQTVAKFIVYAKTKSEAIKEAKKELIFEVDDY